MAQEIKGIGSTLPLIIQSGTWGRAGYKEYLYIRADFAINIPRFVLGALGSGREDDDPGRPKNDREMRKRMRGLPVAFVEERGISI